MKVKKEDLTTNKWITYSFPSNVRLRICYNKLDNRFNYIFWENITKLRLGEVVSRKRFKLLFKKYTEVTKTPLYKVFYR